MKFRSYPSENSQGDIPEGRGMVKWAPFATMPEQFENVGRLMDSQSKIKRPVLSDDRLDEIEHILKYAVKERLPVRVDYYYDGGRFSISLHIIKIDQWSMMLIGQIYDTEDFIFVPFIDILDIFILPAG
ncbi:MULTISPECIES: YolD-like family protein [Jeotgalicoccus]|jgi:YolD-like protein.|uniref:YolD-like family protein n=1 Tax=Jeotgalicoccus nanhaiensis TaxID=568603 RepID=A0ABR9Y108_9STAP|nr:YolD-like family protein [Jeotgalicoccus nanhaiensis]MBF0754670.1 YolD-like family protein [Jeotgalicoccus nanhaiensis]TFU60846.1 YolD-like family protein [Jeotgalicoccus nanhaiensis]